MIDIDTIKQDKKLICIDYDGTFTAAPELFKSFIIKAKELDFKVIACTMRYENETDSGLELLKGLVDSIYFTSRKAKRNYLSGLGIYPQIWIDDMPQWIFTDAI